jgi:subtilisin family serine protease
VDDAFPLDAAETLDTDGDGTGNNADLDDDNDGVNDVDDAFPLDATETLDTDGDGTGNNADLDDDNDGVNDVDDAFPLDAAETLDTDGDGTGNNADLDDDNDGVVDADDERPLDPNTYELPVALPQSVNVDLASGVQTSITGNLTATSQQSRSVTYALVTAASLGTVTLNDASTGAYTYQTLANTTEAGTDSFSFRVNDGFIDSLTTTISISINSDPLYPLQWHLNNSGQATFSDTGGSLGEDLNVDTVTNAGTLGLGTIVAVVDEGMEIAHPDLIENVVADGSYDYVEADNDPTNPGIIGDHGTSVAGIIAARGWNNIGVRGVAPAASLKGFNFLRNQSLSNEIDALGGASNAPSGDVDIFNLSFGVNTTTAFRLNSSLEAQLLDGVTNLRSGNGAIYIKSSGNGFNGFVFNGTTVTCPNAANLGLSCQNTSQDPMHIVPYIIGAAALNAGGTASSYSTVGATNWVSAPGGEFGQNAQFLGSGNGRPAIMTTDQSGCSRGYVRSANTNPTPNPRNAFEDGGNHALNAMCSYTSTFNGTSSAAPNIAGVVALMLSVNADLNWRDVKHILATTSRQIDADRPAIVATGIELEPAWTTNDAGLTFHNVYGFGAIDASAAVVAAEVYVADSLGTFDQGTIRNNNLSRMVADGETITSILNEPDQGIIEFVRVEIFATHAFPGDWTIALISPSGTRSVLLPALNAYTTWPASGFELGSNAFYGESKQGDWTLEVTDHVTDDVGTLTSWSIRIYGH